MEYLLSLIHILGITALLEKALRKIPPAVGAVVSVALFGLTYHAQLGYLGFGDGWVLLPRFLYQNLFTDVYKRQVSASSVPRAIHSVSTSTTSAASGGNTSRAAWSSSGVRVSFDCLFIKKFPFTSHSSIFQGLRPVSFPRDVATNHARSSLL